MFSRTNGAAITGLKMQPVTVETDVSDGLPVMDMVGLLNSEVREAKERVRTALKNTGIRIPPKRITINLSPADIRKTGGNFDLPIAVGILQSLGLITSVYNMEETVFVGELSLDGEVRGVRGVLAIALSAAEYGYRRLIVPKENAKEASVVSSPEILAVENLKELIEMLNGERPGGLKSFDEADMALGTESGEQVERERVDFSEVNGQEGLKRAALVAAAGGHNILFIGPPGSGKTMVASRIFTILPKADIGECTEITKIYSIAGELGKEGFKYDRPFRNPHHTITPKAMAGGGMHIRPGEITLAHRGVLFLDELAEYKRETLEILRQPMESGQITIGRAGESCLFPARFMLVAATNPCKCGYYPDRNRCSCTEAEVKKYMGKISGPLMNRIDITVTSPQMTVEELQADRRNITSKELQDRVEAARLIQKERYKGTNIESNAELTPRSVKKYCYLGEREKNLLKKAFSVLGVSARTYYKTIKVARTIADLDGALHIGEKHIAEAVGYRPYP